MTGLVLAPFFETVNCSPPVRSVVLRRREVCLTQETINRLAVGPEPSQCESEFKEFINPEAVIELERPNFLRNGHPWATMVYPRINSLLTIHCCRLARHRLALHP